MAVSGSVKTGEGEMNAAPTVALWSATGLNATGASLTPVMFTVTLPLAASVAPLPWPPELPSEKLQLICTLAGGPSELLL